MQKLQAVLRSSKYLSENFCLRMENKEHIGHVFEVTDSKSLGNVGYVALLRETTIRIKICKNLVITAFLRKQQRRKEEKA
jgi:hypothetical protein